MQQARWHTYDRATRRYIANHDRSGTDYCPSSNPAARSDSGTNPETGAFLHRRTPGKRHGGSEVGKTPDHTIMRNRTARIDKRMGTDHHVGRGDAGTKDHGALVQNDVWSQHRRGMPHRRAAAGFQKRSQPHACSTIADGNHEPVPALRDVCPEIVPHRNTINRIHTIAWLDEESSNLLSGGTECGKHLPPEPASAENYNGHPFLICHRIQQQRFSGSAKRTLA